MEGPQAPPPATDPAQPDEQSEMPLPWPVTDQEVFTVTMEREVFDSWCGIGDKFCLTSHSQIATFLVHSYQSKGNLNTTTSCQQCGGALSHQCVACLTKLHQQKVAQADERRKRLQDQINQFLEDAVQQEERAEQEERINERATVKPRLQEQGGVTQGGGWNQRQRAKRKQPRPKPKRKKVTGKTQNERERKREVKVETVGKKEEEEEEERGVQDWAVGANFKKMEEFFNDKNDDDDDDDDDDTYNDPSFSRHGPRKRGRPRKGGEKENAGKRRKRVKGRGRKEKVEKEEESAGPHICDMCGKELATISSLNKHKRIMHSSEFKPHLCDMCSKSFRSATKLKLHKMRHRGEKPHPCDICGKAFDSRYHMKRHRLIHAGVKSHLCDTCGKKFLHKSALKSHRMLHTEPKKHLCDICSKTFFRASNLKEHKLFHLGIKSHECQICFSHFTLSSHLKRHMSRVHMKEKAPPRKPKTSLLASGSGGGDMETGVPRFHSPPIGGVGEGGYSDPRSHNFGGAQAQNLIAQNLTAQNLSSSSSHSHHLTAQNLTAQNLSAQNLSAHNLSPQNLSAYIPRHTDSPPIASAHRISESPQPQMGRSMGNPQLHGYNMAQMMPVGPFVGSNEFGTLFQAGPYQRQLNPYVLHGGDSHSHSHS